MLTNHTMYKLGQASEGSTPRLTRDQHTEVPVVNLTLEKCRSGGPQPRTLALTQAHFLLLVTHSPLQSGNSKRPIIWICIWQLCAFIRHFIWSPTESPSTSAL